MEILLPLWTFFLFLCCDHTRYFQTGYKNLHMQASCSIVSPELFKACLQVSLISLVLCMPVSVPGGFQKPHFAGMQCWHKINWLSTDSVRGKWTTLLSDQCCSQFTGQRAAEGLLVDLETCCCHTWLPADLPIPCCASSQNWNSPHALLEITLDQIASGPSLRYV